MWVGGGGGGGWGGQPGLWPAFLCLSPSMPRPAVPVGTDCPQQVVAELDCLLALALAARQLGLCRPEV